MITEVWIDDTDLAYIEAVCPSLAERIQNKVDPEEDEEEKTPEDNLREMLQKLISKWEFATNHFARPSHMEDFKYTIEEARLLLEEL